MHSGFFWPQGRPGRQTLFRLSCIAHLLILLGLAAPAIASARLALVIEDADGRPLYSVPVKNGSEFALRYTHSVALSPVTDYFVIRDNEIWLERTVYQDFGAGLPHEAGPGQKMTREHGNIVLSGFNRRLGSFQLRVGRVAGHVLLIRKLGAKGLLELPLAQIAAPGSAITFLVKTESD